MIRARTILSRGKQALKKRLKKSDKPGDPNLTGTIFISSDVEVTGGKAAEALLRKKNDRKYLKSKKQGIVKVDRKRWQEAQTYERKTWMELNAGAADDRNEDHRAMFDSYRAITGRRFERAIELGCGPFTNIRLMLDKTKVGSIDLLDPLVKDYLKHPHCVYKDMRIAGRPVDSLYPTSVEDFKPTKLYDLVIMINVLEHCFDAQAVFEKTLAITAPGGYFVFHDKLYTAKSITPDKLYDAGHPLRIKGEVITTFLKDNFKPKYEKLDLKSSPETPLIYYIGTKK